MNYVPVVLVSTTHHLLAVDISARKAYLVHTGKGLYYGLAQSEGRLYVACRNQTQGPDIETIRAQEAGSILCFDQRLELVEEIQPPFPLRDVHGIAMVDQKLYVTCSYDNLIAVFDTIERTWSKWYPSPDFSARSRDVNHFNTVAAVDGKICLLAHNFGESQLFFYSCPALDLLFIESIGYQAHNVFSWEGSLATCSSGDGLLVGMSGWRLRTGGFPRGICEIPQGRVIGISSHTLVRSQRSSEDGFLRLYTHNWRWTEDFRLAGVGMILDLLPVELTETRMLSFASWPGLTAEVTPEISALDWASNAYLRDFGFAPSEWYAPEDSTRWSAARHARLRIVINPDERKLRVAMHNGYPGPYPVQIFANNTRLGELNFAGPQRIETVFVLPTMCVGAVTLRFEVDHLWKPSQELVGKADDRGLGISLQALSLLCS